METHGLLVERILFLRAYRDAREAVTHAEKQSDIPAAAITLYTAVQEEVFAMEDSG